MINKSELMLGNTIVFAEDGTVFTVTELDETGAKLENRKENTWIEYEYLEGCPIKANVLEQMGFVLDDSGYPKDHADYCDWYEKDFPIIGKLVQSSDKTYLFDENTDTLRIKHVHELQNLINLLTTKTLNS